MDDVEQTIVYSDPRGVVVRLKDVAEVRREYAAPTSYVTNRTTQSLGSSDKGVKCISAHHLGVGIRHAALLPLGQHGRPAHLQLYGTLITMLFILTVLPIAYWLVMSGSTRKRLIQQMSENQ